MLLLENEEAKKHCRKLFFYNTTGAGQAVQTPKY